MEELLFTFDDTHDAIRGEKQLLEADVGVRVMSLPSAIRAGCGLCLRVPPGEGAKARQALQRGGIPCAGLYLRKAEKGDVTYTAAGKAAEEDG